MLETRSSLLVRVRDPANQEGWTEFVTLYEPLLLNYARRMGLADHDAADAVQEIFIRLMKTLRGFELDRERGRFRTWLYQIAKSGVEDWRRGKRRAGKAEDAAREIVGDGAAPADDTEEHWLADHRRRVVEFVMGRVRSNANESTWASFEQHLLQGRPAADVAAALGLSKTAVYANSSRILARVRELCLEYEETLDEPASLSK